MPSFKMLRWREYYPAAITTVSATVVVGKQHRVIVVDYTVSLNSAFTHISAERVQSNLTAVYQTTTQSTQWKQVPIHTSRNLHI